jgi:hypothetical protein
MHRLFLQHLFFQLRLLRPFDRLFLQHLFVQLRPFGRLHPLHQLFR